MAQGVAERPEINAGTVESVPADFIFAPVSAGSGIHQEQRRRVSEVRRLLEALEERQLREETADYAGLYPDAWDDADDDAPDGAYLDL